MGLNISAERLSDVIASIYDCVIVPSGWEATLRMIHAEFELANAALTIHMLPAGTGSVVVTSGIETEWLTRGASFVDEVVELWGGAERVRKYPLDEPILQSSIECWPKVLASAYRRDWCLPQGLVDQVMIGMASQPTMVGALAMGVHRSRRDVGEDDLAGLRLLAPHLRRAVTISGLLDLKEVETRTLTAALDAYSAAIILVDEQMAIVHANRAGEEMLAAGDPVTLRNGRLTSRFDVSNAAIEAAVAQSALDESGISRRGIGVPLRTRDGEPRVVHVLPLSRGEIRPGLMRRSVAALFIAPAAAPPPFPGTALGLLYELTPAETRILEMIAEGHTQAEIASELGIAPTTVKTHLLRVFDKTGTRRQADLVRLVASLSLPF